MIERTSGGRKPFRASQRAACEFESEKARREEKAKAYGGGKRPRVRNKPRRRRSLRGTNPARRQAQAYGFRVSAKRAGPKASSKNSLAQPLAGDLLLTESQGLREMTLAYSATEPSLAVRDKNWELSRLEVIPARQ
jgi:hypothetical protein